MNEQLDPRRSGLVGRDAELARMDGLLNAALAPDGRARAALITGPSGVGKTALLQAFRRQLRAQRQQVLEGWCVRTDHRPHGPLVDLLGATAQRLAEVGHPAEATERALARIAGLQDAPDARREDQLLAFYEAVRLALVEAASALPPVIILHDLHRADTTTLRLIRYLLDNLLTDPAFEWGADDGQPLCPDPGAARFRGLLMLSFRITDATRPLLEVARSSTNVEELALAPLDEDGVRGWLARPDVVARLHAASGGLPAALTHLIDALPDDPAAAWRTRFDGLDPRAGALLDVLAVFERPATPNQLAALVDDSDGLVDLLKHLTDRGLVERTLERGRFAFRMPGAAAREAYLEGLAPARRQGVHRRIAEQLARAGGAGLAEQRHIAWCLERVRTIGQALAGPGEPAAVAALHRLWPELRVAF
ncbi:MAG: AAA family ATPase, partial [Myxococcales bacterium]|nr:AAA family ATPase [Myxococcales bacterium]